MNSRGTILLTGLTGYIGSHLAPHLLAAGYRVRAMVRKTGSLAFRPLYSPIEFVEGDPLKSKTLPLALTDIQTAFYFIHSMTSGPGFRERDIVAARQFGQAAKAAGVGRIIYLGGLGDDRADLSEHLRSRHETGEALREAGVPVTEFRAAVIVGAGSISFEMVRYLTERLPIMICPRWVFTKVQPIAIDDVLAYLMAALEEPETADQIIEIGGADVLTYGQMMTGYGSVRGLRRFLMRVPVLTPRLSSYWIHWVTPIQAAYARPLIEGLRNEVVVRDDKAQRLMPKIHPTDYATAVRRALDELNAEYCWQTMDCHIGPALPAPRTVERFMQKGLIVEQRRRTVQAPAADVYRVFSGLGGEKGWLCYNRLWQLRGWIDRRLGGPGLRRTRPQRPGLQKGDIIDFYEVEHIHEDRLLRLRVQMRLPGQAWLQFHVRPIEPKQAEITQTVFFAPKGLLGLLYWYALYPIHTIVFSGMFKHLVHETESH